MDKLVLTVKDLQVEKKELGSESPKVLYIKGYANRYLDSMGQLVVDRSGDSVIPTGYELTNFMKNPILLSYHSKQEPIGKVVDIKISMEGLEITAEVHELLNPTVYYAVEQGILKTFSIGFKSLDTFYDGPNDIYYYKAVELLEVSIVSVPDNQDSIFTVLTQSPCATGMCMLASKATDEHTVKCANTIKNKDISSRRWNDIDKAFLLDSVNNLGIPEAIKEAYLIVGDVEKQTSWKFPHHEVKGNTLLLNKEGLLSALSALKSAKDVEKFSVEEKLDALKHLEKHFNDLLEAKEIEGMPSDISALLTELTETKSTEENTDDNNPDNTKVKTEDGSSSGTQDAEGTSQTAEGNDTKPAEITFEQIMSFVESIEGSDENVNHLLSLYDKVGVRANTLINEHLTQTN
jgi:HK97 family phage prohead protease